MKFLQIHNYYHQRGGEDRYADALAQLLEEHGHSVARFLADSRAITRRSRWLLPWRLLHDPRLERRLLEMVEREKPQAAVVHNLAPLLPQRLLAVLKQAGVPVLKRLENYKFLCLNGLFLRHDLTVCEACREDGFLPGVRHRCYRRSFLQSLGLAIPETVERRRRTVLRHCDRFLASSRFVREKFTAAGFPASAIDVLPNFLDSPPPPPAEADEYILYLGRLAPEKGVHTLLRACDGLAGPRVKIVGGGPAEATLRAFVHERRLGGVEFCGFLDGPAKWEILRRALFTVFPSECYESFGYTIAESLACGVPVVCADGGAGAECIREGVSGMLFRRGDAADLRRVMERLLGDRPALAAMRVAARRDGARFGREEGYREFMALAERLVQA